MTTNSTTSTLAITSHAGDEAMAGLPAMLDEKSLAELGLSSDDIAEVQQVALQIRAGDSTSVSAFGRDAANKTASYADDMLSQVRNSDLEDGGKKLSQVVTLVQALNMGPLSKRRSRLPFIGPVIDRFTLSAKKMGGQFESTKTQVDHLVHEIEETQDNLRARNKTLEAMFQAVQEEHHSLGVHIAAGKVRLVQLRAEASAKRPKANSPVQVQEVADLDAMAEALDLRIANLQAMQQSALQTLPQVRIVQRNNDVLTDKFDTIRQVTVPAWKRQFALALGLNEQRNTVEVAQKIDDATNALLRGNAELLYKNSVDAAKANQRLVIDIDTLQDVQNRLIETVQDVVKIQQEGARARADVERQLGSMRDELRARLTNAAGAKLANETVGGKELVQ